MSAPTPPHIQQNVIYYIHFLRNEEFENRFNDKERHVLGMLYNNLLKSESEKDISDYGLRVFGPAACFGLYGENLMINELRRVAKIIYDPSFTR